MQEGAEELKASLRALNEQDGPAFKIKDDPRVSFVGSYLRRTCIDEFPQFWNVLIGDMSLVGPRPLPVDEAAECEPWQRRRTSVTPGMTCIWQVSGGTRISFTEWMRMDLRYARSRKLLGDLALLWKTFWVVVLHRASH
jgi:lipopolysaccharide/colanic/teichoic acid biosynthesis glycosyltransferase